MMEERSYYNTLEDYVSDGNGNKLVSMMRQDLDSQGLYGMIGILDTNMFFKIGNLIEKKESISEEDIRKGIEYNSKLFSFLKRTENMLIPDCIRKEIFGRMKEDLKYKNNPLIKPFKEASEEYFELVKDIRDYFDLNNGDGDFPRNGEFPSKLSEFVTWVSQIYDLQRDKEFSENDVYIVCLALSKGITEDKPIMVYSNDKDISEILDRSYRIAIARNVSGSETKSADELRNAKIFVYGLKKGRMTRPFESDVYNDCEWEFRNGTANHKEEITAPLRAALRKIDKELELKIEERDESKTVGVEAKPDIDIKASAANNLYELIKEDYGDLRNAQEADIMHALNVYKSVRALIGDIDDPIKGKVDEEIKSLEKTINCKHVVYLRQEIEEFSKELEKILSKPGYANRISELAKSINEKDIRIRELCEKYDLDADDIIRKYAGKTKEPEDERKVLNHFDEKTKKAIDYLSKQGYDVTEEGIEIPKKVLIKAVDRKTTASLSNHMSNLRKEGIEFQKAKRGKVFVSLDNIHLFFKKR